jgi:hypothetical protein
MSTTKYIDYLKEDKPIPGQLWVCMSFLSPEGIKNCSIRGIKVRGVFNSKQEADEHAKELQKIDSDFHVFVGEMGKWLPWDPEPNDVADQHYYEKELNDLMKGYKDNLQKASKVQEERKEQMIKNAARTEQSRDSKTKDRLQKKLAANKNQKKMDDLVAKNLSNKEVELKEIEESIKKDDELVKAEKARLDSANKQINETEQKLDSIDSKLARIQELYSKIQNK